MFYTYRPYTSGIVLMGNDASCSILGIGTIKIKIFDGMVRTLCDVRHVSEMKKNLISLGTLESNGFSYTAKDGILKVVKDAIVVIKGHRKNSYTHRWKVQLQVVPLQLSLYIQVLIVLLCCIYALAI